jgi:oligopeptide transport system substrate-binding protein
MVKKLSLIVSIVLLASMVLTACGPTATQGPVAPQKETVIIGGTPQVVYVTVPPVEQPTTVATRPNILYLASGPTDTPTIDPSLSTDTSSVQIVEELTVGLLHLNEETVKLDAAMADSYTISDDGLVYTFKLHAGVPWVRWNGDAVEQVMDCQDPPQPRVVTAYDFEYAFKRTCDARTASDYAYVFNNVLKGCKEFNSMPSTATVTMTNDLRAAVGAKAIDANTLELTFLAPAAYNLSIASMWIGNAEPSWIIEGDACTAARGERWWEPGFNQSYGPFALKEWIHDSQMVLIKNPFWPADMPAVPQPKIDEIVFRVLDATPSLAEYEAGNLDVSAIPLTEIDRVKSDPVLSKEYYQGFSNCTYYLGYNTSKPPVDNVHLRRALSMALDRQTLIDNVIKGGQIPAQWFCRPGMVACPTPEKNPDVGIKSDETKAKEEFQAFMTDMGYTSVDQIPEIVYMFNTSESHRKIAEAIQQRWVDVLGVRVTLINQDWATYLNTYLTPEASQIWRMGWCSDYPDANNWDLEVFKSGNGSNPTTPDGTPSGGVMWKNDTYNQLVTAAATEQDPAKRLDMYIQAENILVYEDAAIIPVYWYTSLSLTKPYIQRTYSLIGRDAYEKWEILP